MITLPISLIDRKDFSLLQRALLPVLVRLTYTSWGSEPLKTTAPIIASYLQCNIKEVIEALDDLVKKNILKTIRIKTTEGMMIHYQLVPHTDIASSATIVEIHSEYNDPNHYLNLPEETFRELETYALEVCDREGIDPGIFTEFNLYQRSKNNRSFDWNAEFDLWMRRQLERKEIVPMDSRQLTASKPTTEEFTLVSQFINALKVANSHFVEPFDRMSWAKYFHAIIQEGYSTEELQLGLKWLFSQDGHWLQKNVWDARTFFKHFKLIYAHSQPYKRQQLILPNGMSDVFELYDLMAKNEEN